MGKRIQKVSGDFRTDRGAPIFLTIKSDTGTHRKRSRDAGSGLPKSIMGSPFLPSDAQRFRRLLHQNDAIPP